jgi:hypothetical protein
LSGVLCGAFTLTEVPERRPSMHSALRLYAQPIGRVRNTAARDIVSTAEEFCGSRSVCEPIAHLHCG